MKIRLLVIGTRTEDWVAAAVRTYRERLPAHLRPELVALPSGGRATGRDPAVVRRLEGEQILRRLRPDEYVIVLDESGRQWRSADLAGEMAMWQKERPAVALVVGGADGLAEPVRARADRLWSLSALTFPHGLVRVIVIEQLYRAWTILQGHPYHKA